MAQLTFEIRNQTIQRTDSFTPKSKSLNYLVAHFDFLTTDWNDVLLKTALFEIENGPIYKSLLDENGDCPVPWEVLENPGTIYVSVFGGNRITVGRARVRIGESGYVSDSQDPEPPHSDVYEQVLTEIEDLKTSIDGGSFTDWN